VSQVKEEKKKTYEEPIALQRKRLKATEIDSEQVEFKILDSEDIDDILSVLRRTAFEIGEKEKREVQEIIDYGLSYGAYVDRLLVGLTLIWPLCFNEQTKAIFKCSEKNALYMEDITILIAYEGKGIREKLLELSEQLGSSKGYKYLVSVCGENPKEDDIKMVIEQRGTKIERALLNAGYKFFKGEYGLTAYKRL
jgi:hypothetical protein